MSTQTTHRMFHAPALLVEARFRERLLCAKLLSSHAERGFTIGAGRRADTPVDPRYLPADLPSNDNHALVTSSAVGFLVHVPPGMVAHDGPASTHLRIACGEVVFDITAAAPAPIVPRTWLRPGWGTDARITWCVALGLLALLLVVRAVPVDPHALSLDDVGRSVRLDAFRTVPPVSPRVPDAVAGGSVVASGSRGAAGDRAARPIDARRALAKSSTKGLATGPAVRQDLAHVTRNTMLALLDGAAFQAVVGERSALGPSAQDVLSHLAGRAVAQAWGIGGFGPLGTGAGGGDTGQPMLPGSGLTTVGSRGRRAGPGGYGDKIAGLGSRKTVAPEISMFPAVVRGGLDKEIVRRVVRAHLNEVRYCYEEALPRRPTLAGRVVAEFTIASTGRVLVSALQTSSLGAPAVETCIVAATRRWQFPQPAGGGLVVVSYPFQLAPEGG